MILISHRGNISKKNKQFENNPEYILNALRLGYEVEVDIWKFKDKLYLGHDEPQFLLTSKLSKYSNKLWFHAKNIDALPILKKRKYIYFWHQTDDVVLTSNGYWWTFPGKKLLKNSICVMPKNNKKIIECAGICSDEIEKFK